MTKDEIDHGIETRIWCYNSIGAADFLIDEIIELLHMKPDDEETYSEE